jgi:AcrR family transcriptional regulator
VIVDDEHGARGRIDYETIRRVSQLTGARFAAPRWRMVGDVTPSPEQRDAGGPGRGGRARDPVLDGTIAQATKTLLEERGVAALTIEAVARRAGVARATVYRRWPNRNALLLHLLRGLVREFPIPDRGHVRDDLVELLAGQLALLEREAGKLYPSLAGQARTDRAASEAVSEVIRHRRAAIEAVLRRAITRRQIRGDIDVDVALALLWGPVYYRYLGAWAGHAPIERDFVATLVDHVLLGIATTQPTIQPHE